MSGARPKFAYPPPAPPVPTDASVLWRVIERAAADPSVDLDRLDRLSRVYERMVAREAETRFNAALVKLQPQLPVLEERGEITDLNGKLRATYATWEDTVDAIRPLLARHGFSLTFRPGRSAGGVPVVTGVLRHRAGHKEEAGIELPADASGDKNPVQAVGSTMSYGQRYVTRMLLNLTSRGEDDDGAVAGLSGAELSLISEINSLEGRPASVAWKRESRQRLAELPGAAFQRVIGVYCARVNRMKRSVATASGAEVAC